MSCVYGDLDTNYFFLPHHIHEIFNFHLFNEFSVSVPNTLVFYNFVDLHSFI